MISKLKSRVIGTTIVAVIVVGCGKNKTEKVFVTQPQTVNPQSGLPQLPTEQPDAGQNMARTITTQVGDLFSVSVPPGMHIVYRSSTFDQPGFLKFRAVDASNRDSAFPYPLNCRQNANFEELVSDYTPAGRPLSYCEITPPVAFNAPGDPLYNSFRWMTSNTMSYNSLAFASDSTLGVQPQTLPQQIAAGMPVLSKMYINVFTKGAPGAPVNQQQAAFSNELNQTVSRLQISCGSQIPQYLGNAVIFQGYFSGSVAVSPLFGCVSPRAGKYFVSIAAFPMDQITPMAAQAGWNNWINQSFANRRAAEIVVEIGPFDAPPMPSGVAPVAQSMMAQHIKRLTL